MKGSSKSRSCHSVGRDWLVKQVILLFSKVSMDDGYLLLSKNA